MRFNKNINYATLVLYLKYGYISLPGFKSIYKNKKINTWIKPPYKTNLNTTTVYCLNYLEKKIEKFIKKQKKKKKKICLLLSSGQDSRLLYKILEKKIIELNYKKNFFNFTGCITHSNKDYDEAHYIKKFWRRKPINHHVIRINQKNIINKIFKANRINFQPINGLPNIIFMSCVEKICKKFGRDKVTLVTGISDQIFFNSLKKQAISQQKKKTSMVNANEGTIFKNSNYLKHKYDEIADKLFSNIKTKIFFKQRHFYHKYINQMAFNFRGPKVVTEFQNIFKYFKIDYLAPFVEKEFQELILSLKIKELHDGKNKKTFIHNTNLLLDPNQKNVKGLKIITPQREIIYQSQKKIRQIINTSILIKKKIIDKKKIVKLYNRYLIDYKKYKKNKKMFAKFNSYTIWKFLSAEIFLRSCR